MSDNNSVIASNFRGLVWEPGSEQEVVCLFGMMFDHLPWPIAIDEVRDAYPDCLATRTDTNTPIRIEFELYGSNFRQHCHDPSCCDVVVCWKDDLRDWPDNIAVIELASLDAAKRPDLVLRQRPKKEARMWDESSFHDAADDDVAEIVRELERRLAGNTLLQVRYNGRGKDATCNVCLNGKGEKLLWIWADGRYQWCWEGFRGTESDVVRQFQTSVDSENKSSCYIAKPGAITRLSIVEILNVLAPIAEAAKKARGGGA